MRPFAIAASLALLFMSTLMACGGAGQPAQQPPPEPPPATALPPTVPPPPTATPEPTPTPLSLSDLDTELRTFVNKAHGYAIQVPLDWEITPRGASRSDTVEVSAPGPTQIRGPNVLPPLTFSISALEPEAGIDSLDDVEAALPLGEEVLDKIDLEVNGWPARRIRSRVDVFGTLLHYIIQLDGQFFVVKAYGYDQAPIEPILSTFGPPPNLTTETVIGQIQELDAEARTLTVDSGAGSTRRVVWFTDTEILPDERLEGHIDLGDRVGVEGIVADDGELQATQITLQAPEHAGGDPVLEFRREGGIAGFHDMLVIFDDGTALLQRGGGEPLQASLSEDQWKTVKNHVSIFKPFAWHFEDNPGGPDNLVTDLDFYGTGKFEAVSENQEEIVADVQEVLQALAGGR